MSDLFDYGMSVRSVERQLHRCTVADLLYKAILEEVRIRQRYGDAKLDAIFRKLRNREVGSILARCTSYWITDHPKDKRRTARDRFMRNVRHDIEDINVGYFRRCFDR